MSKDEESKNWIQCFIDSHSFLRGVDFENDEERDEALKKIQSPKAVGIVTKSGMVLMRTDGLLNYIVTAMRQKTDARDLSLRMVRLGFKESRPRVAMEDGATKPGRRIQRSPDGFLPCST